MSSAFRITQSSIARTVLNNLQGNVDRVAKIQEELSSGRSINRPSDDPGGTLASMQYRGQIARTNQFSRNASDGLGWLGTADNALTGSLTTVRRVRDLALQGANATMGPTERAALAEEVDNLRNELIGIANTAYQGRPIFAGNAQTTAAFDANGNYLGDMDSIVRTVAPNNVSVPVNVPGPTAFAVDPANPTANDLFKVFSDISADLRSGSTNLTNSDLTRLDQGLSNVQNQVSRVGALYNRLDNLSTRADDDLITVKNNLAEVESVDLPKTIVELQLQQTAYQAALSATAKVVQPSLLDFLK